MKNIQGIRSDSLSFFIDFEKMKNIKIDLTTKRPSAIFQEKRKAANNNKG